ncbi:hypothetical protein AB0A70_24370 [Streptomyces morookaense]|uniref:hypothetical protein n=1 Tax=Streptomyces morookaense TaxID=1970 RepID=UPI0033C863F9
MDDHGDEFGRWLDSPNPAFVPRTEEQREQIARYVRHAANKLGPDLPVSLPGEPQECGRSPQQHVLAWAATVKAAAHHIIEQAAPTPAEAAYAAGPMYQQRLLELRKQAAGFNAPLAPAEQPHMSR